MRNEAYALDAIRSYELAMSDGWRNDFCESAEEGQQDDENRRENMLEQVASALGATLEEAEEFYDRHSR